MENFEQASSHTEDQNENQKPLEQETPSMRDLIPVLTDFDGMRKGEPIDPSIRKYLWTGPITDYTVEIELSSTIGHDWGAKAYIQSEDGVVLDRVEVLHEFFGVEELYDHLVDKLADRLNRLKAGGVTGSFPFVTIRR